MRKYIKGKITSVMLLTLAWALSVCLTTSCQDEAESNSVKHNLSLEIAHTRAGTVVADLIPNMKLFTFDEGGSNDKKFREEILNITRTSTNLTAKVQVGNWYMAMIAPPAGASIIEPNGAKSMALTPMYQYAPVYNQVAGKSNDADELFFQNTSISPIQANVPKTVNAQLNRTVAMVELVLNKATANFNTSATTHQIKLHNVPSTISYTGALLPNKAAPDTLSAPLTARLKLSTHPSAVGYLQAETIKFIIPSHQGTDFLTNAPQDTTQLFMNVSVDLERTGGTRFRKTIRIPRVARCNHILRVNIEVNDGIEVNTTILPWEVVELQKTVGDNYKGWVYVKKGATGGGLDWTDALPSIREAITTAAALRAASIPVKGILVAGGTSRQYTESPGSLILPADVKIFGGWEGTPGTELPEDETAPYTSTDRNLKTYKAHVLMNDMVYLPNANSVLDGFVLSGTGNSSALLVVANSSAWVNAIEIDQQQSLVGGYALQVQSGALATNVLVSRNNKGVFIYEGGRVINATIVDNSGSSNFATDAGSTPAVLLNSIYRGTAGVTTTCDIKYCAFQGTNATIPATGTKQTNNYPLSSVNNAWFTASNIVPGPHFNAGLNTAKAYYEIGTTTPNRSPMLGRGDETVFNSATTKMPALHKKDINGNPRHHLGTDIGCYEDTDWEGFKLRWGSDRVYVSAKGGYVSDIPLLLPDNETHNIGVSWTAAVVGTLNYCTFNGPSSGSGTGVMVGNIKMTPKSPNYTATSERQCGVLKVSTNLGAYLPDVNLEVWQTPGASSVWYAGYVGSFHRNSETSERYITGENIHSGGTYSYWSARIISGLDWIKIDGNSKGANNKVVEETFGGFVSGSGGIKFRVGMKSTLASGSIPRYGLIVISRGNQSGGMGGGVALFFVRQGEGADYIYRPEHDRPLGYRGTNAKKFSPYSLTDPQRRASTTGSDLGVRGAAFTDYPTQIGYYFKWNATTGYLRGATTSTASSTTATAFSAAKEVCPAGYRHATMDEWVYSAYTNAAIPALGDLLEPGSFLDNFVWGRYADGYYDQIAPDPVIRTTNQLPAAPTAAQLPDVAMKGILMINHYNYASVFFPTAGTMIANGTNNTSHVNYAMNHASSPSSKNGPGRNTHWNGSESSTTGHIGMNCTGIGQYAAPVRCVKDVD